MHSSSGTISLSPSPARRVVKEEISRLGRPLTFAEFSEIALYHPETGYYRKPWKRIGKAAGMDFLTAPGLGSLFGELVVEAASGMIIQAGMDPLDTTFVEIGAEPGDDASRTAGQRFGRTKTIRLGDPWIWEGPAVVFSNELFDAQPFHRLTFLEGKWRETGVAARADGSLEEVLLPEISVALQRLKLEWPTNPGEGYRLDLSPAAAVLAEKMAAPSWDGLFLAFDYGKTWQELTECTPQGTARAYRRHRQSINLTADPGEQDLTCHVCWDWLEKCLIRNRFESVGLISQEAFFIRQATRLIGETVESRPGQFDPRRRELAQLLHPGAMGQKFQVLHGLRKTLT